MKLINEINEDNKIYLTKLKDREIIKLNKEMLYILWKIGKALSNYETLDSKITELNKKNVQMMLYKIYNLNLNYDEIGELGLFYKDYPNFEKLDYIIDFKHYRKVLKLDEYERSLYIYKSIKNNLKPEDIDILIKNKYVDKFYSSNEDCPIKRDDEMNLIDRYYVRDFFNQFISR